MSLTGMCLLQFAGAQQVYKDVLYLQQTNNDHLTEYYSYYIEPVASNQPLQKIDSLYKEGLFKRWKWHQVFNPGYIQGDVWLRIAVKNSLPSSTTFLWSVYNYVDSLYLYKISSNGSNLINSLAGKGSPSQRPFPARNLTLPFNLHSGESSVLYLKVIRHGSPIYFPTDITNVEDYLRYENKYLIVSNWYWLIGFFLFAILFSLILLFSLKDSVYIWYAAYVACNVIFLFMEDGLDALIFNDYLYRSLWNIDQYNFLLLSAACGIGVMHAFIKQMQGSFLYSFCRFLIFFNIGFVLAFAFLFPFLQSNHYLKASLILNRARDGALLLSGSSTLLSIVEAIVKRNKLAYYYGLTYLIFILGSSIFFLNRNGFTRIHLVEPNQLAIGLFIELLLLLFFLTLRFQFLIKRNAQLKMREFRLQRENAAKIILAQDEERHRLAQDLHDDLGNTLTRIRLLLGRIQNTKENSESTTKEMKELVEKAATDVRNITHELMPVDLQEKGLFTAMKKVAEFLSHYSGVSFRFFSAGLDTNIPYELQLVVYRIFNELTSNIIKHAHAAQAELQCILYENYLLLTAEDDGQGMGENNSSDGIGLKNIQNRVQYLQGKVNIDSGPQGTTIIIEIPFTNGE